MAMVAVKEEKALAACAKAALCVYIMPKRSVNGPIPSNDKKDAQKVVDSRGVPENLE